MEKVFSATFQTDQRQSGMQVSRFSIVDTCILA
jgi:hypothetical protein